MNPKPKAIGLLSGGLDSTLALRIIHDQGIEVIALNFHTGFCFTDARRATKSGASTGGGPSDALSAAANLGIPIEIEDISQGYLQVLHHPQYGYGKNVNPCVDCRIYMFILARQKMEEMGAEFVFTGEVLGQRPKSQHMRQLGIIAQKSGLKDRLLRPLSALLLPETLPEKQGIVDRSKLFGFHGRTRKPQMALAAELGIEGYPSPAGGCCFLTDPAYGRKVKDLWENSNKDELEWEDYLLLKVGRHIRISSDFKVIVGRNEGENLFLRDLKAHRIGLEVEGVPGPYVLIDETPPVNEDKITLAASIAARYSDGKDLNQELTVRIDNGADPKFIKTHPLKSEEVNQWVIH